MYGHNCNGPRCPSLHLMNNANNDMRAGGVDNIEDEEHPAQQADGGSPMMSDDDSPEIGGGGSPIMGDSGIPMIGGGGIPMIGGGGSPEMGDSGKRICQFLIISISSYL